MALTPSRHISASPEDTKQIGHAIGRSLRAGDAVLLRGELGTGKSVLARGVAEGLRVTSWRGSPTFTLVNEYRSSPPLFHVDLYRLSEGEVERLGLEEYARPDSVLMVEWPERAGEYLTGLVCGAVLELQLEHLGGNERLITAADSLGRLGQFTVALP